jgi:ATP-binding cassette subfamily F protein 2
LACCPTATPKHLSRPFNSIFNHHCRPSDAKKKKAAAKKGPKSALKATASSSQLSEAENNAVNGAALDVNDVAAGLEDLGINDRSTTGVLTSHPQSRDIHFESFGLLFHGHELLTDTTLELNYGRCLLPS